MKASGALIAIFASALAGCSGLSSPSEEAIAREMLKLVGPDVMVCGLANSKSGAIDGWECAVDQDRKGQAFWFAVGGPRTDSEIWHIIARTQAGERFVLFYTSNNSGQPGFEPHFTRHDCNESFRFFPDELFMLRCGEDVP